MSLRLLRGLATPDDEEEGEEHPRDHWCSPRAGPQVFHCQYGMIGASAPASLRSLTASVFRIVTFENACNQHRPGSGPGFRRGRRKVPLFKPGIQSSAETLSFPDLRMLREKQERNHERKRRSFITDLSFSLAAIATEEDSESDCVFSASTPSAFAGFFSNAGFFAGDTMNILTFRVLKAIFSSS